MQALRLDHWEENLIDMQISGTEAKIAVLCSCTVKHVAMLQQEQRAQHKRGEIPSDPMDIASGAGVQASDLFVQLGASPAFSPLAIAILELLQHGRVHTIGSSTACPRPAALYSTVTKRFDCWCGCRP